MRLPPWIPLAALLGLAGLISACGNGAPEPAPASSGIDPSIDHDPAETLAIVNGQPILRTDLFAYAGHGRDPDLAHGDDVLDEIISLELLRQEAVNRGLDHDDETRRILRQIETNLLASQLLEEIAAQLDIREQDVAAEYERQVERLQGLEYRAAHILLEEETQALEVLEALEAGEDFDHLAARHSQDPGSAEHGGALGWFVPGQMVPEFSAAVEALEPGSVTSEPVQSPFGWHLIRLDETRPIELPALEEARAEIIEILESRAIQSYLEDLRSQAKIELPQRPENGMQDALE